MWKAEGEGLSIWAWACLSLLVWSPVSEIIALGVQLRSTMPARQRPMGMPTLSRMTPLCHGPARSPAGPPPPRSRRLHQVRTPCATSERTQCMLSGQLASLRADLMHVPRRLPTTPWQAASHCPCCLPTRRHRQATRAAAQVAGAGGAGGARRRGRHAARRLHARRAGGQPQRQELCDDPTGNSAGMSSSLTP